MSGLSDIAAGAKALVKKLEASRKERDKSVNNERTRREGTTRPDRTPGGQHLPNPRRNRKDILDELT